MRVGVLGAGQLGRMLALAGTPLGMTFRFLDPAQNSPAGTLGEQFVGDYSHGTLLERFARDLDVVTYEFENVPVETARRLRARVPVYPDPVALETAQDRMNEKTTFQSLGIPTPRFAAVDGIESLNAALAVTGLPAVMKTRRMGYDGKGQQVVRTLREALDAVQTLGGAQLIAEQWVPFQREVSLLAVRGRNGETAFYSLVENHHREGILRQSISPAPGLTNSLQHEAEAFGTALLDHLGYTGLLAVEFFEVDGHLVANEMAPRVHNSGHGTIEGCVTSQFENHLRAIAGLPLGRTANRSQWIMMNLIGDAPDTASVLMNRGAHLHLYGKAPRPGRKVGHITYVQQDGAQMPDSIG